MSYCTTPDLLSIVDDCSTTSDDDENNNNCSFIRSKVFIFDRTTNHRNSLMGRLSSSIRRRRPWKMKTSTFKKSSENGDDDDNILTAYCRSEEPVQTNMDISTGHTILVRF